MFQVIFLDYLSTFPHHPCKKNFKKNEKMKVLKVYLVKAPVDCKHMVGHIDDVLLEIWVLC